MSERLQVVINSKSSGKFREVTINRRPHIVTSMISIEGDTVMNKLFYPNNEVIASHLQLDRLPAPIGHPMVDGMAAPASDPAAVNAHNIGAFVLDPKINGKKVINDLAIDIEVAEKDERGQEVLNRIRNGERIGVSTGLTANKLFINGKHGSKPYNAVLSNMEFDHVAILLDRKPAGDNTFTQNASDHFICNLADSINELREMVQDAAITAFSRPGEDQHIFVEDILLNPDRAVIAFDFNKLIMIPFREDEKGDIVFTGQGLEVDRKVTFEPIGNVADDNHDEETDMEIEKLVLALIGNALTSLTADDSVRLMAMSESALINAVVGSVTVEVSVDDAKAKLEAEGLTINEKDFDSDGFESYLENKDAFIEFTAGRTEKRKEIVAGIIKNTEMTEDDLKGMDDETVEHIANSLVPNQDYSAQGDHNQKNRESGDTEVDYSDQPTQ